MKLRATVAICVVLAVALVGTSVAAKPHGHHKWPCVPQKNIKAAKHWAKDRAGHVGFAFYDDCRRTVGWHEGEAFASASVVKAMMLVAYLRKGDIPHRGLHRSEKRVLRPMIEKSDNDAANKIYVAVGAEGLNELAHDANLKHFHTQPLWGATTLTPATQARFFAHIERYIPKRHESYAMRLLASVVPRQRWGLPRVQPRGWRIYFKGGWAPSSTEGGWRINQVATLRTRRRSIGVAVMTRQNPSKKYGTETIEGVGKRLLRGYSLRSSDSKNR
jgi:beta-lactamase class A